MPSLAQLDQAVREFIAENPSDNVTVVVDASFGHRIDPSELPTFEAAEAAGEVVSPPAGAIGRGDAFLLRIAEKTGATVLSNDSFQEFHGEHLWLFEKGRLIGGKPVPGVGWIFMERTPVRGAKSREVTKEAKRRKRSEPDAAAPPAPARGSGDGHKGAVSSDGKSKGRPKSVDRAIARATEEVVGPKDGQKSRRRRGGAPPAEPVNEPLAFITFIAAHPLGSDVIGAVLEYSSHGAFVDADGARCYVPLSAMGDPPPRRAREVVFKGESRPFVVQAFDPLRRGIELALPGFAKVAGGPTAETVEAEIAPEPEADDEVAEKPRKAARKAVVKKAVPSATKDGSAERPGRDAAAPVKKAAAKKAAAKKAPAAKKAVAQKAPATKAGAQKVTGHAAPAATKAAVKKAPAVPKAAATKKAAPAKPAAPQKKAAVKKSTPAKKAPAVKKATAAKPAPAKAALPGKAAPPAKRAVANRAAPNRAAAKSAGAKKAGPGG